MKEKLEQDADLFRQSVDGVMPLAPSNRITPTAKPRKVILRHLPIATEVADYLSDHGAGDNAASEFLHPGLNRIILRKLRRGEWPPQDDLDLHGLKLDAARSLLVNFLHDASQRGLRCVNIIHGKGWRSEGRDGVLKVHTRHWLTQHRQVLGFCEAPVNAGGGGAVWVLLKTS